MRILCKRRPRVKKQKTLTTSMRANLHQTDTYSTNDTSFSSSRYRPIIISNTADSHNESNRSQSQSCSLLNTSMPHALQNYSPMNPLVTQNQYHGNIEAIPITYQPPTTVNNEVYPTNKPNNILKNQTNKNSSFGLTAMGGGNVETYKSLGDVFGIQAAVDSMKTAAYANQEMIVASSASNVNGNH